MRATVAALAWALWLALPAPARGGDPAAEAPRSYRIATDGTTRRLSPGAEGRLVLAIVPQKGRHVNPAAPLQIVLSGTRGLKLSRRQLDHGDALDPGSDGPRFEVPFTATAAGAQKARAQLEFYVCSKEWCEKQVRDLTVPIRVE